MALYYTRLERELKAMLVLSRRKNEWIYITVPPSDVSQIVRVRVAAIKPEKVQLGVEAAREIVVHRDEIQTLIDTEKH